MRKGLYIFLIVLFISVCAYTQKCSNNNSVKEGDIVFQMSTSNQSKYIAMATGSPWTHCGIIIERDDKLFVLEAVEPVKLTRYTDWKERGRFGMVSVKRYTESPIHVKYKPYIGTHYDTQFRFNNGKWYCSELIYYIYKNQLNVELCTPHKVSDFSIIGVKSVMKKRGIRNDQLVVSPSDLYNSSYLYTP